MKIDIEKVKDATIVIGVIVAPFVFFGVIRLIGLWLDLIGLEF